MFGFWLARTFYFKRSKNHEKRLLLSAVCALVHLDIGMWGASRFIRFSMSAIIVILYGQITSLATWIFLLFDKSLIPLYVLAPVTVLEVAMVMYELSLTFDTHLRYLTNFGKPLLNQDMVITVTLALSHNII